MTEPRPGGFYSATTTREEAISEALGVYDPSGLSGAADALIAAVHETLDDDAIDFLEPAIERVSIASDADPESHDRLIDDIYVLRSALADWPTTSGLLDARSYLSATRIPDTLTDLRLDHAVASEQISFATVVRNPGRVPTILTAIDTFRRRYRARYTEHHDAHWREMSVINARLEEAGPRAAALARLNSLEELGPPVGEMAIESISRLVGESSGCPSRVPLNDALAESPLCPACSISLDQEPPSALASELLNRLDRSLERHMSHLSSAAVRDLLERKPDPRIEKFLRIVTASQLSSLVDILDDQLTNYLRRFLLEGRIHSLLDPVFDRIERGETDDVEDTQRLQAMAALLERAVRSPGHELPPPDSD